MNTCPMCGSTLDDGYCTECDMSFDEPYEEVETKNYSQEDRYVLEVCRELHI